MMWVFGVLDMKLLFLRVLFFLLVVVGSYSYTTSLWVDLWLFVFCVWLLGQDAFGCGVPQGGGERESGLLFPASPLPYRDPSANSSGSVSVSACGAGSVSVLKCLKVS
jgi:hypothetical protein